MPAAFDVFSNYSVSGQVTLYIDGVRLADDSGRGATDSAAMLDAVEFASLASSV